MAFAPARASAGSPMRIVSLAPSVTETLFALGAGPEVVGVSQYCGYPEAVTRLPKVGTFLTPNVEAIAGLKPTLVIGLESSSNIREIHAIEAMDCPTLMVSEETIEDIQAAILKIGERIGRAQQAHEMVRKIQSHISLVRQRLMSVPPRRVLMLVGHQPIVAVGPGTFLDELLRLAGGANVADRVGESWPRLSIEYIIAMAPEVILDGQMGSDPVSPNSFWAQYPSIPAVKQRRVYGYPQDLILHPGPRVWQSLDLLAAMIHPEVAGNLPITAAAGTERDD
jgi:cobalamin transport system substrate-binding protein